MNYHGDESQKKLNEFFYLFIEIIIKTGFKRNERINLTSWLEKQRKRIFIFLQKVLCNYNEIPLIMTNMVEEFTCQKKCRKKQEAWEDEQKN